MDRCVKSNGLTERVYTPFTIIISYNKVVLLTLYKSHTSHVYFITYHYIASQPDCIIPSHNVSENIIKRNPSISNFNEPSHHRDHSFIWNASSVTFVVLIVLLVWCVWYSYEYILELSLSLANHVAHCKFKSVFFLYFPFTILSQNVNVSVFVVGC